MNNLLNNLSDISLPPVTVRVDEDSLRNLFITAFLLGSALILVAAFVFKGKN